MWCRCVVDNLNWIYQHSSFNAENVDRLNQRLVGDEKVDDLSACLEADDKHFCMSFMHAVASVLLTMRLSTSSAFMENSVDINITCIVLEVQSLNKNTFIKSHHAKLKSTAFT